MRKLGILIGALIILGTSGCGGFPITPDQMRETAKSSSFAQQETERVRRPFDAVVQSIAERAPTCLRGAVRVTTTQGNGAYGYTRSTRDIFYTPTFVRKGRRAELYLQSMVKGTILVGENKDKLPKAGWYIMVVDIVPDAGGTRLDFYRASNLDIVVTAIKQWASATGRGCPDLTKL
jgi:hypothetical protein